ELRHALGIGAVIVPADAQLRVDEHEPVAVGDRLRGALALAGRQLGDTQAEAVAYEPLDRVLFAGEKEPAGSVGTEALGVTAERLGIVARRIDGEAHGGDGWVSGVRQAAEQRRERGAERRADAAAAREDEVGDPDATCEIG